MAGGSSNDLSTPWPKGEYPGIPLIFSGLNKTPGTGSGAKILASMTLPFSCKCLYAEFMAGDDGTTAGTVDADNDSTLKVIDDTGTPKEFVTAQTLGASLSAGARKQLTVNKSVEFYAQAILQIVYTSTDTADGFNNGTVVIWVKPTN